MITSADTHNRTWELCLRQRVLIRPMLLPLSDVLGELESSSNADRLLRNLLSSVSENTLTRYLANIHKFILVSEELALDLGSLKQFNIADILLSLHRGDVHISNALKALRWAAKAFRLRLPIFMVVFCWAWNPGFFRIARRPCHSRFSYWLLGNVSSYARRGRPGFDCSSGVSWLRRTPACASATVSMSYGHRFKLAGIVSGQSRTAPNLLVEACLSAWSRVDSTGTLRHIITLGFASTCFFWAVNGIILRSVLGKRSPTPSSFCLTIRSGDRCHTPRRYRLSEVL